MTNKIREAVGVFVDVDQLKSAINELYDLGITTEELGLLASEQVVESSLDDMFSRINHYTEQQRGPSTAFVAKESLGSTFRSMSGGLIFTGASTTMGIAVASAGIFGGALVAAAAGAAAVVTVGALVGVFIQQGDAEDLEEQVEEGHILLFVRINNPANEPGIIKALSKHACFEATVHEVAVVP